LSKSCVEAYLDHFHALRAQNHQPLAVKLGKNQARWRHHSPVSNALLATESIQAERDIPRCFAAASIRFSMSGGKRTIAAIRFSFLATGGGSFGGAGRDAPEMKLSISF
jgi:hypothetical protein